MNRTIALVFAIVALAGCQSNSSTPEKADKNSPNASSTNGGLGAPETPTGTTPSTSGGSSSEENSGGATPNSSGGSTPNASGNPGKEAPLPSNIPSGIKLSEPKPVQPAGLNGWGKTTLSKAQLASNMAKAMGALQKAECRAVVYSHTPEGTGTNYLKYRIATQSRYRLEYLSTSAAIPSLATVLSDGRSVRELSNGAWRPVTAPDDSSPKLASDFLRQFSRVMLANVIDKKDPWGKLFSGLDSAQSQFSSSIEERVARYEGHDIKSYRIVAKRKPEAERTLGPASMEIVVDAHFWLPVTIRTEERPEGGKPWNFEWTAGWKFGQNFSDDDLAFSPKKAEA